jgi:hypothetical protein
MSRLFRWPGRPSWPARLVRIRHARTVGLVLATGEGVGAVIAVAVIITNLVRRAAVPGLAPLLVAAVPVVFAGQVWMIGLALDRFGTGRVPLRTAMNPWAMWQRLTANPDRRLGVVFIVLVVGGWLTAMTAFPAFEHGDPAPPTPDCRYPLEQHGSTVCASAAEYQRAGAGEQRFLAGILLCFLALHTSAALGGITRHDGESNEARTDR